MNVDVYSGFYGPQEMVWYCNVITKVLGTEDYFVKSDRFSLRSIGYEWTGMYAKDTCAIMRKKALAIRADRIMEKMVKHQKRYYAITSLEMTWLFREMFPREYPAYDQSHIIAMDDVIKDALRDHPQDIKRIVFLGPTSVTRDDFYADNYPKAMFQEVAEVIDPVLDKNDIATLDKILTTKACYGVCSSESIKTLKRIVWKTANHIRKDPYCAIVLCDTGLSALNEGHNFINWTSRNSGVPILDAPQIYAEAIAGRICQ